jgi:glycosyltransferase involved in cell wall biosynthesis
MELRKWNPDIIYSNTMTVCFGAILATVLHKPHVWHLHEIGYEDHGLKFDFGPTFSYKVIDSLSTACIAVSKITADRFAQHIDPAKLTVIYPSVHRTAHWAGGNENPEPVPARRRKVRCVIVGRLSEGKRQEDAVLAFSLLKQKGVDAELLVIGRSNPGYREKLDALVREHGLEEHVSVIGSVVDRLPYVESADIILMCSRCEAFGRVTVEGMLAGKAVVAANSGANPELIQDGVNGVMYKMGDTSELATKIQYLAENLEVAKRMGESAKSWSRSFFTKERYAEETISLLNSVVQHRKSDSVEVGTSV